MLLEKVAKNRVEIVNEIPSGDLDYIIELINNDGLNILEGLGKGTYGIVYGYKTFAIKKIAKLVSRDLDRKLSDPDNFEVADAIILKELQGVSCIPTLYAIIDGMYLVTTRIVGKTVKEYQDDNETWSNNNFVDVSFNEVFKNALIEILDKGYNPYDMHKANVMIDGETGLPVIVDVGFFQKHDYSDAELDRIKLKPRSVYVTSDAMSYICDTIEPYINEKKKSYELDEMAWVY